MLHYSCTAARPTQPTSTPFSFRILLLLLFSLSQFLSRAHTHTNNDRARRSRYTTVFLSYICMLHGAPSTANNQLMAQRTHLKKVDARSLATKTYSLIKIPLSTFSSSRFRKIIRAELVGGKAVLIL